MDINAGTLKKIGIGTVAALIVWHLVIMLMPTVAVSGFLRAKPATPGYSWADLGNADSRFFWNIANVQWQTGLKHPEFNV